MNVKPALFVTGALAVGAAVTFALSHRTPPAPLRTASDTVPAAITATSTVPLPLGSVSTVTAGAACGGTGALVGATCTSMAVHCPGTVTATAIVAVTRPAGASKGTVVSFLGGGGTDFYNTNEQAFVNAGYTAAQVRWTSAWELSGTASSGLLAAGCRPATVMQWVYTSVQGATKTAAYCAIGHSGGSGAVSYALSHYGAGSSLDYASLGAGPPFGRIDYGCNAPGVPSPRPLCPTLPNAPYLLGQQMNMPEGTTTCGAASPSAADIAKWAADSIVSPGAAYSYPQTVVDFYDCTVSPNGTTGGAYFYSQAVTSSRAVTCVGASDGCQNEGLGSGGNAKVLAAMLRKCVPRH